MKLRLGLLLVLIGAASLPLAAQTVTVPYQQQIEMRIPGATAAYSFNSFYADASVVDGVVVIQGNSPGSTTIMVVSGVGVHRWSARRCRWLAPPESRPPPILEPLPRRSRVRRRSRARPAAAPARRSTRKRRRTAPVCASAPHPVANLPREPSRLLRLLQGSDGEHPVVVLLEIVSAFPASF